MSNIAEQDILSSNESTVIENSLAKLKNDDPTSEFVVPSDGGDLADQLCNSFTNITNQITPAGDAATDVGFLCTALMIPESDVMVSSTDDELIQKTDFPLEELITGPTVEIDMKRSPSYVSEAKPECLEEPIIRNETDAVTTVTVSKTKRRSVWKRTKRFFRRLFCCGGFKDPSSGIIAEPTDFVDDEIDTSSLPATGELIDSSRPAGDFLPQTTLRVDDFRAPIATDCEPIDPPTALLEEEFSGSVKTDIQSNRQIEGPMNERSASMRILDLPTMSVADKHDIDDWPPIMIEVIERISAISKMVELPPSADEYQQQTHLDVEELSCPIETNVRQSMYDLEGPLYNRFGSMMTLDLPMEFVSDKVDIDDWPPAMIEVIEPVVSIAESPRSTDQFQLETTLQIDELNGQIETDPKQSSCDQDPVSDLLIVEAKPKHRAMWKRMLCCCC